METQIIYKIKTASAEDIFLHLAACKDYFTPALDKTVNILEYSKKIFEMGLTFEAWKDKTLIGLVAGYFNKIDERKAFITDVSLMKEYHGKGIASELMKMCVAHAAQLDFKEIELEVFKGNISAIDLYRKFNFINVGQKDDKIIMSHNIIK